MSADADTLSDQAEATLARLMPHLHRQPDLPGLQRATRQVQRTARRDTSRVQNLVDAVADDPGLSARLLRLSNSVIFASSDAGHNTSLDRAVRLLGFSAVQQLAAGLPLLDRQPDGPGAREAREDFLRALLAAQVARELSLDWRDTDAAHLIATFQNLGRMLVATHLPDDAQAIRKAAPRDSWPLAEREQHAALHRLGWRYDDLGLHVAQHWGWPEALRNRLRPAADGAPQHPNDSASRQRCLARLANDSADLLLYADPQCWPAACEALAEQARGATAHDAQSLQQALERTQPRLPALVELVGLGPDDVAAVPAPTAPDEQALQQLHRALSARRAVLWRAQPGSTRLSLQRVLGEALPAAVQRDWSVDPQHGTDLFSHLCRHGRDSLIDDAHQLRFARHLPTAYRRGVNARSFLVLPLRQRGQPRAHGLLYLDRRDDRPFKLDGDALQLVQTLRAQALA